MADNLLICGTNWLGDSIMSMPAVQALKKQHPEVAINLLCKESLLALWQMHSDVDSLIPLRAGVVGTWQAVRTVRSHRFRKACVLSHSLRAALIPFLARVPERRGTAGRWRAGFLNHVVEPDRSPGREHQTFEYLQVLGVDADRLDEPYLEIPANVMAACQQRLKDVIGNDSARSLIGLIPGAARGPSKRWPAEHFVALGQRLTAEARALILVFGAPKEQALCARVAGGIGRSAFNLAGATTLSELAGLLSLCKLVIGNDSGGGHLAAAVGTPVAVIFGATDPAVTGPLGAGHVLIQIEGAARGRAIERHSVAGRSSLERITPDAVFQGLRDRSKNREFWL